MIFFYILIFCLFLAFSLRYNWWRVSRGYEAARVLMYHSIDEHYGDKFDKWRVKPKDFERQISWLHKNGFKSYTISELVELKSLAPKSVAITFDDGYGDNFTNAFEILQKFGFKATIYLVPNQTANHWESVNTTHISQMLSNEQIAKMQSSNLIEFGSHTLSHANLLKLDDIKLKEELTQSKKAVESIINAKCRAFAYPYGKYDERVIKAAKDAGYTNAVIVKRGLFTLDDEKFTIKRIGILGTESFFDFWLKFTRIRNKL